jgi:hypothetical protein
VSEPPSTVYMVANGVVLVVGGNLGALPEAQLGQQGNIYVFPSQVEMAQFLDERREKLKEAAA